MSADLQTRLTEAEEALHALNTGQAVAETQIDNIRTKYAIASGTEGLIAYIADLRSKLGTVQAGGSTAPTRRRPLGVMW